MPSRLPSLLPCVLMVALFTYDSAASAQDAHPHVHQPSAAPVSSWHLMQDGVALFTFNDQGGPRGGRPHFTSFCGCDSRSYGTHCGHDHEQAALILHRRSFILDRRDP